MEKVKQREDVAGGPFCFGNGKGLDSVNWQNKWGGADHMMFQMMSNLMSYMFFFFWWGGGGGKS